MVKYLTSGEYKFLLEFQELHKDFGEVKIFTLEQIKKIFPELADNMISFYLTSLTKKGLIHKIRNGLYYIPEIELKWEVITPEMLVKYVGFKKRVEIYFGNWENQTLWLGIDKCDVKKVKDFRKLYKEVIKNVRENTKDKDLSRGYKKVKFRTRQSAKPKGFSLYFKIFKPTGEEDFA